MKLDGYEVRENEELNTIELVERYEFHANIMSDGSQNELTQAAVNTLYKLRVDMHKKIHELLKKDECEFCFKE